jgi:hypothetical protein
MIYIPVVQSIVDTMLQSHIDKELFIDDELKNTHVEILNKIPEDIKNNMFVKIFICCMIPQP